jgi:hypothetical protein
MDLGSGAALSARPEAPAFGPAVKRQGERLWGA